MGRPVVLSNGQLFIGLDEAGLVHDFYYPYVGLENLTNARNMHHKIGVWVDGAFHWTDDGSWQISVLYEDEALVSDITMYHPGLQLKIQSSDFVDTERNAFVRHLRVINEADRERDVRLFMHQVFQISRAGRADTALFVPDDNYILDYKGRCCLLIAGRQTDGASFDQFAVGNYAIEGKAGTFKDAEDGELSGNAVEHGGVDSVFRFRKMVPSGDALAVDYWIVAADSQVDAQVAHTHIKYTPVEERLQRTRDHWQNWLSPAKSKLPESLSDDVRREVLRSLMIIKAHCDDRGSILASGDSSIFNYGRDYYCYCWPRDAAMAVWPLIRLGLYDEARNFFEFARSTMHRDGYLMHKYQPDRAIGSTWHPLLHAQHKELAIQEDETATVIIMIGEYLKASQDVTFVENYYETFIEPCASFLANFVDRRTSLPHASYDLWEQKFLTSTYTVSTVIAGLETASELARAAQRPDDQVRWKRAADDMSSNLTTLYNTDGYFRKGFLLKEDGELQFDDTLDLSSLFGPVMFARLPADDPRISSTLDRVKQQLLNTSPSGGVIRYPNDGYFLLKQSYKGNPWAVCALWLARCLKAAGQDAEARELVDWTMARRSPSGVLSEQYDPENGLALSVSPLVWSHAEFINAVLDLDNG